MDAAASLDPELAGSALAVAVAPATAAVLVQWPHEGMWTIAFLTGAPGGAVAAHLNAQDYISVYVPTTPNPTGGYFVMVHRRDVVELAMSVDEALTYVISMGVIVPGAGKPGVKPLPVAAVDPA